MGGRTSNYYWDSLHEIPFTFNRFGFSKSDYDNGIQTQYLYQISDQRDNVIENTTWTTTDRYIGIDTPLKEGSYKFKVTISGKNDNIYYSSNVASFSVNYNKSISIQSKFITWYSRISATNKRKKCNKSQ